MATKLYEVKTGSKIYGLEPDGDKDGIIVFGHIDGMYSYCWVQDKKEPQRVNMEKLVHLNASTPLVAYKDGYKVAEGEE